MKKLILVAQLIGLFAIFAVGQNTSVYVSPHPDDWQLFFNPNISHSILTQKDTVIILHTTAGDAGAGMGNNNYTLAREEGSLRGMRFIINSDNTDKPEPTTVEYITINNHRIKTVTSKNVIAVFLRLPDGGGGTGYPGTNYESLKKLYNGDISTIAAVDGSTEYESLNDLKETIKQLILQRSAQADKIIINVPDTDESINPGDHRDHRFSSFIVQDIADKIGNADVLMYQMYATGQKAANIEGADYHMNVGTWGATTSGLADEFHSSTWNAAHNAWVDKQYFRKKGDTKSVSVGNIEQEFLNTTSTNSTEFEWQDVSVFVCAHPEDWQLFMNPNAYHSLRMNGEKVIFLHLTSGDEGNGVGNSYYLAKEEGSKRGVRHMSNAFSSGADLGANMNDEVLQINNHSIKKCSYRNATMFFLRLPDANENGEGYWSHNTKSLEKLYKGGISEFSSIDETTSYNSINDLKTTIKGLIGTVVNDGELVAYHMIDDSLKVNPNIHSDRLYGSKMMREIAEESDLYSLFLYQSMSAATEDKNLAGGDLLNNFGAWGAGCSGIMDWYFRSGWGEQSNLLVERQYFRQINPFAIQGENIALNKPTYSSSDEPNSESSKAVDGDIDTWWGANPHGEWWMVDLEDVFNISHINVVNYYQGQRYYRYNIEASTDNESWTKIVDYDDNNSFATAKGKTFSLEGQNARYLRVNMTYNSVNVGVHINEFRVFGDVVTSEEDNMEAMSDKLTLYPNPVLQGSDLTLEVNSDDSKDVNVDICDVSGRRILSMNKRLMPGNNQIFIPTSSFTKGIFMLVVSDGATTRVEKFIVK